MFPTGKATLDKLLVESGVADIGQAGPDRLQGRQLVGQMVRAYRLCYPLPQARTRLDKALAMLLLSLDDNDTASAQYWAGRIAGEPEYIVRDVLLGEPIEPAYTAR